MKLTSGLIGVALCALCCSACGMNESGNLEAQAVGDTGRSADRGSPTADLQEACGAAGTLADRARSIIHRDPYVQQLTASSVIVGWLTSAAAGQHVEVSDPTGRIVTTAQAEVDDGVRVGRDQQVWARVTGLQPDTIYCYALTDTGGALTERIGFRTAPTADSTRPIRILAFGDSGGGGSDQHELRDRMFDLPFELMIHTGDLAYDSGTLEQYESTVFDVYADLLRHIGFYPASGNHDLKTLQGAPFREVFALPDENGEQWYSYDYGPIHFAALDTEASYTKQAEWLDRDLARTRQPWKIVYMHRPPYSSGEHGSDMQLRNALAPVLAKHGVQLVLAGHDHNYERMKPQDGIAYVVTGGGGVGTRSVGSSPFTAFAADVIHFVYLEVGADELVLHAIDATGNQFDSVVVPRSRTDG